MEADPTGAPIDSAPPPSTRVPAAGQIVECRVGALAHDGRGVARIEGFVLLLRRGLPGDRVSARVTAVHRNYAEGEVADLLEPGPDRLAPPCPIVDRCGGCPWMPLDPSAQLLAKERLLGDALERVGGIAGAVLEQIVPSPRLLGYRNRIEFHFANGPRGLAVGLNSEGPAGTMADVDACLIGSERIDAAARAVREALHSRGLRAAARTRRGEAAAAPEESGAGNGLLWNLVIRESRRTGDLLVHLVTMVGALAAEESLGDDLMTVIPGLTGVVRTETPRRRGQGPVRTRLLAGRSFLREQIGRFLYEIEAGAFFQVNTEAAERLYADAVAAADPKAGERVLDLYAGVLGLTLPLAERSGRAIAVESAPDSIASAQRNARAPGVGRIQVVRGEARRAVHDMARESLRFEVVCVNPPRSGLHPEMPELLASLAPRRLVYVSCNPGTLARDLAAFGRAGLRLVKARPYDLFPHSPHLETIALLEPAA